MRSRWKLAACVAACIVSTPAAAQGQAGGVPTETQEREKSGGDGNILWNTIGLVGLLGATGQAGQGQGCAHHLEEAAA